MTLQTDASIGIKKETTYGTAVTVTRWLEYLDSSLTQDNKYVQGKGLRVSKIVDRQARRTLAQVDVKGDIKFEACSSGLGPFFEAMLGSATSTNRSGAIYQQNYVPATTDPMPSYTIQAGLPPIGGGSTLAHTYDGCVCDKWTISADTGTGIVQVATSWKGKELVTATSYAAPSYAAAPELFTFVQGAVSLGVLGTNAFTAPTTTALATIGSAATPANITKFTLNGDNGTDDGGRVFGSAGKRGRCPVYGMRSFTGEFVVEFTDNTWRDYYLNQTALCAIVTFTAPAVGTVTPQLSIAIPAFTLEGDVPSDNAGKVVTTNVKFTVLDGEVAASPLYISMVTADTAI